MVPFDEVRDAAREIHSDLVADRRTIHQQPELAYEERQTSALVADRLRQLGLEVRTGVGETGVIGVLHGAQPGKTVLLRADMDALPILEENTTPYVSRNPGVMHACGHDAHTAILLGVARVLTERRDRINGTVKFMFQPAEEGGAGAKRMIDEGLLEHPVPDAAFALHVDADRYVGQVALCAGAAMAAADRFVITVRGKGGHAAAPHRSVDPIVVAAHIVTALQTIVSREVTPTDPAVITVANVSSGNTFNVIPDVAVIKGTVRTFRDETRTLIQQRFPELVCGIASAMRATAEVDYRLGYPTLVNDEAMVELVGDTARDLYGPEAAIQRNPVMGAEDFAYVLENVPGAMFYLGVRDPSWQQPRPIHTATFDINEDALPIGVAMMAATALRYLGSA